MDRSESELCVSGKYNASVVAVRSIPNDCSNGSAGGQFKPTHFLGLDAGKWLARIAGECIEANERNTSHEIEMCFAVELVKTLLRFPELTIL